MRSHSKGSRSCYEPVYSWLRHGSCGLLATVVRGRRHDFKCVCVTSADKVLLRLITKAKREGEWKKRFLRAFLLRSRCVADNNQRNCGTFDDRCHNRERERVPHSFR